MTKINLKKISLGMLAFMFISFVVQAMSHFVINVEHFSAVEFMRKEPILSLGIATMLIQGAVLSYIYSILTKNGSTIWNGIVYGNLMGIFLVSYIALVEPSKYTVPSVLEWIAVETISGFIQFSLFGLLLGYSILRVRVNLTFISMTG